MNAKSLRNVLLLMLLTVSAADASAAELRLATDGKPTAVVVLGDGMAHPAAAALIEHIRQISGATLPAVSVAELGDARIQNGMLIARSSPVSAETFILLGESQLTRQMGLSLDGIGPGGIRLKSGGNTIALLERRDGSGGKRRDITSHAVFSFLETLGCRYLWPGETGKVVPQKPTLAVADLDIRFTPSIGQRHIRFTNGEARGAAEGLELLGSTMDEYRTAKATESTTESAGDWSDWHELGGDLGIVGGEAGCGLRGGWEQYGKAHPEWFALQPDGTRDQANASNRWRLCVSNPGLIEHVASDIIARLNGHAQKTISLCPNDGGYSSFCMCDACRALDAPNGAKIKMLMFNHAGDKARTELEYVSLTDRYVHYWNAVAERVTKVVPDQLFLVQAYSYYSDPPVREKLHPNLVVRYAPNTTDGWNGWQDAGAKRIYWRPNNLYAGCRIGILSPRARENSAAMSYFAAHGMLATDMDSIYNNWATQGLHYYAMARLNWNPAQDFDTILNDYCDSGFGAGAEHVKRYFRVAENGIVPGAGKRSFPQIAPQTIDDLRAELVAAARTTENDIPSHRRVAFLRAGFEFTAISAEAHRLADAAENGTKVDAQSANSVMDRRWQLMRAILKNYPLAVNVGVVAANDTTLNNSLHWKGPSETAKRGKLELQSGDDWLNDDQTMRRQ